MNTNSPCIRQPFAYLFGSLWLGLPAVALLLFSQTLPAQVAVLTQHNDNNRSGMNLNETILNVTNVNANAFGSLGTCPVDDQIYAQPLVMTNVSIPGAGTHNLLILATANDSVYAYDADNVTVTNPYWQVNFLASNAVPPQVSDINAACGCTYGAFTKNFGIVGTPVIDPSTGTIYVVAMTKETNATETNYVQRLHALDARTGAEQPNSPIVITASCPGNSIESSNGVIQFQAFKQNQRPGLLLVNGIVYIAWASYDDFGPYHGWILGYSTTNLTAPPLVFNDSLNSSGSEGGQGGIWMSNTGLGADTNGNIYAVTGNGVFDGVQNFGECTLKLTPGTTNLTVASWFAPYNWVYLNDNDQDLATAGMMLVPNTSLMVCLSKLGMLYVVNRDKMGGLSGNPTADTNIVQSWSLGLGSTNMFTPHGGPTWWTGPDGSWLYIWPAQHASSQPLLQQYQFNSSAGQFDTNPVALNSFYADDGSAGGVLSVSANGTNAGTGILWAIVEGKSAATAGTLHAFNAENVAQDLWDTTNRDSLSKWVSPTIANGKVYVPTTNLFVRIYGLYPLPPLSALVSSNKIQLSWPVTNFPGFTLQSSANLTSGPWGTVTNSVSKVNGTNTVLVSGATTNLFFRLKR